MCYSCFIFNTKTNEALEKAFKMEANSKMIKEQRSASPYIKNFLWFPFNSRFILPLPFKKN